MKAAFYFTMPLFCLFNSPVMAQSSVVRGLLTDSATGEPLLFAEVRLYQDSTLITGAYSDVDGYFSFRKVDPGEYVFMTHYLGYEPYTDSALVVGANKTITFRIDLKEAVINLQVPVVKIECPKFKPFKLKQK